MPTHSAFSTSGLSWSPSSAAVASGIARQERRSSDRYPPGSSGRRPCRGCSARRERHRQRSMPERDPSVRRRAHRQRVEQEAELRALVLGRDPRKSNMRAWSSGSWIRIEPPASSIAVADEVVGDRAGGAGSSSSSACCSSVGRVNGWCCAVQRSRSSFHSSSGNRRHPEEVPCVAVDEIELAAEVQAEQAEHLARHLRRVGAEQEPSCPARRKRSSSGSERNFAIGERTSPSSRKTR